MLPGLRDPFSEELLPYSYPSDPRVPRPKLLPHLEQLLYDDLEDRSTKNSHPWLVEFRLRRGEVLPAEDVVRHHIFFNSLIISGKINLRTVVLLPDIMCAFLEELFRETDARDLKARWGQEYVLIRNYFDFLQYRLRIRDFVFKQHKIATQREISPECRALLGLLAPVLVPPVMDAASALNMAVLKSSNFAPLRFEAEKAA